jgi:hypothetical protein
MARDVHKEAYGLVADALNNSAAEGYPDDPKEPPIVVAIRLSDNDPLVGEFIDREGPGGILFLATCVEEYRSDDLAKELAEEWDRELDVFLASEAGAA